MPHHVGAEGPFPASDWPLLPPLAMFLLASLIIRWPWLSGRMTIPWDAKAHFQPQVQFLAQSLANGESPFWAPFVFGGHPQVADPQAMIFSPPFLLLSLINGAPSLWAVDATVMTVVFLGGAALIVWFRDQGWHWAGALIAAMAFAYGAAMAWRIQHTGQVLSLAYLPIAILCLDRALSRGSLLYGAAGGLVAGCIVLGRDQVALLCVYLLAGFVLWRLLSEGGVHKAPLRARWLSLAVALLCGLALAAVPVTLTALFAAESNRPEIDFFAAGRGSLHPALLLTAVVPDVFGASGRMEDYWGPPSFAWPGTGLFIAQNVGQLYIGAMPLLMLAIAARGWLWEREVRFFAMAALAALFYALGWYTPVFRVFYALLPGVSLFRRPADAVFLIGALSAILAGYAVHRLFRDPVRVLARPRVVQAGIAVGLAIAAAVALALWRDRVPLLPIPMGISLLSLLAAALGLVWAAPRVRSQPALATAVLAAITVADLAVSNGPSSATAQPPAVYEVLEPLSANATITILKSKVAQGATDTRRDRVELAGLGFHWPNASLTHELENTLGYNPLRIAAYSRATGAGDHAGLPDQREFTPLFPSYRSTLANLLGLRFIATGAPIETIDTRVKPDDLALLARTTDGFIYENPDAMDRVLFATSARSADFERIVRDGVWPDADLASTVLLEAGPAAAPTRRPGSVRIIRYENTDVIVEASSPDGGWVVLNDLWHPWWFAEMDGAPVEILKANVLFRAVFVPPGDHRIRFRFRPLRGAWHDLFRRRR